VAFFLRAVLLTLLAVSTLVVTREIRVEWLAREPGSLRQAVLQQQSPGILCAVNAKFLLQLADGEPDQAARGELLGSALAAHPRSVAAWIRLGLEQEQGPDGEAAEKALLQAAYLDHQLLPVWTLANFYFRQNRQEDFWEWGARAAQLTYDDYRPLLQLADRLEPDADGLLRRLEAPPGLTRAYLNFLVGQQRMGAAQHAARFLLRFHDPADRKRILSLADRQLAAGHHVDAEELWNAIANSETTR